MAATGVLFYDPRAKPLSTTGTYQPGCYLYFYTTGTTTQATVYADGLLTVPLTQPVVAAADGRFVPIYLSPSTIYRVQLYSATNVLLEDTDPFVPGPNLSNYVTTTALNTALANYVTQTSLNTQLAAYLPVTTAASTYMPLTGGTFTGPVNGVTPAANDNSTLLATTAYVQENLSPTLIRAGTFSCINGTVSVSFAAPFPTSCDAIVWSPYYEADFGYFAGTPSATGFHFTNANPGECSYIAIGH
jgi:hypothetical protein